MSDCSQQGSWAVTSLEACEQGPIVQIVGCCGGSHREEAARSDISIGQEQVRAVLVRVVGGQLIERALQCMQLVVMQGSPPSAEMDERVAANCKEYTYSVAEIVRP